MAARRMLRHLHSASEIRARSVDVKSPAARRDRMQRRIGSAIPISVAVALAAGVAAAGAQQRVAQYRSTNCPVQVDSVRLYGSSRDTAVIYRGDSTIVRDSVYASRPDSLVMYRAD